MKKNSFLISSIFILLVVVLITACSPDDKEVINLNPNAGPSFENIENEGYVIQLNAVPVKPPLVGTWRIYIGEHGSFEDIHDPRTKFYGEPGESYQLGWEVSDGTQYEASTITVSFKAMVPVIIYPEESVDILIDNVSYYLEAKAPKFGASGNWEIVNGINGRILNSQNYRAEFIGKEKSEYTIRWNLTYGSKVVSKEVSFKTDVLRANAGPDQLDIITTKGISENFFSLEGYLPAGSSAKWSLIRNAASGKVYNTSNPKSIIQGIADSIYTLTWKVDLDEYSSIDSVNIRFRGKWGMWKDNRDKQTYKFTVINGLEWMAENYNYAALPGNGSWVYGFGYRSIIEDGNPLETVEDRKKYGRLYTIQTARDYAPEGWRLPTANEVTKLIISQGGTLYAKNKIMTGGITGLELNYPGYLEFSSPSDPALRNAFKEQDKSALYWTNDYFEGNGTGYALSATLSNNEVGLTVIFGQFYALPVRYVRNVQ